MKTLVKPIIILVLSTLAIRVMAQSEQSTNITVDSLKFNIQFSFTNSNFDPKIYKEGIKAFKELIDINPNDKDWNYYLGMCLYKMNRFEEAEKYLSIASEDMLYKLKILYLKELHDTRSVKL